jgi:Domain of unknown function (DUF2017)
MLERRRIERTARGDIRLRLPRDERALLRSLPGQLRRLLAEAPEDPSLERLFPPAYDDTESETEYRQLMGDELLEGRRRALRVIEDTLDEDRLTTEQAESWLTGLNDLRLVLGTRLDVTDETLLERIRPDDPDAFEVSLYAYLSWLQEQLVEALEGDFRH